MYIYECHILIDPTQEETLGSWTTIQQENDVKIPSEWFGGSLSWKKSLTVTSTGIYPRQPMLSAIFNANSQLEATQKTLLLQQWLISGNLTVVRTKLEALMTLDKLPDVWNEYEYLESHIKIECPLSDWHELQSMCLPYGVQLLINPTSQNPLPVTTMRRYNTTAQQFAKEHSELVSNISKKWVIFKIHVEHGLFDSNVITDSGWLFPGKNYQAKITEVDCDNRLKCPVNTIKNT